MKVKKGNEYKEGYYLLFNAATDAEKMLIEAYGSAGLKQGLVEIPADVKRAMGILRAAQAKAEEIIINGNSEDED
jgi:hypothetical protein